MMQKNLAVQLGIVAVCNIFQIIKKGFDIFSFTSGIKMKHFLIATNEPTTYLCDFCSTDRDSHKLKAYSPQYFPEGKSQN